MHRSTSFALLSAVALLNLCILAGCGKTPPADTSAAAATSSGAQNPSTAAVTKAASNFLEAVIKGDTQRAGACLTPQAMQRIIASGKPFAPPGMQNATFRVGEVRTPSVDKAFVSCMLTENSTGTPQSEEICCLMRLVDNEWRICGIAAYAGPNQNGVLSDFETGQEIPIPRTAPARNTAGQPAPTAPATGTLPPRVATEPTSTSPF